MEQRFRIDYEVNGKIKSCYPRSTEDKEKNIAICKERGYKVVCTTKLYPLSTNKHQHNFMLVVNRCNNLMYDMDMGYVPYNKREYDKAYEAAEKAGKLFQLPLPVAWVDGKTLREAKRLSAMAINWRVDSCIDRGRYDLIEYCY